jgi:hypothetical protein
VRSLALIALFAVAVVAGARDDLMNALEFRTCSDVALAADLHLFTTPTLEQALRTLEAGGLAGSSQRLTFATRSRLFLIIETYARTRGAPLPVTVTAPDGRVTWRTGTTVRSVHSGRDLQRTWVAVEIPRGAWRETFGDGGLFTFRAGSANADPDTLCTAEAITWALASAPPSQP